MTLLLVLSSIHKIIKCGASCQAVPEDANKTTGMEKGINCQQVIILHFKQSQLYCCAYLYPLNFYIICHLTKTNFNAFH